MPTEAYLVSTDSAWDAIFSNSPGVTVILSCLSLSRQEVSPFELISHLAMVRPSGVHSLIKVRQRSGKLKMNRQKIGSSALFGLSLLVIAALSIACSGDNEPGTGNKDGKAAPSDRQILRTRIQSTDPKTIDPHLANFGNETTIDKPLFSTLFAFDENLKAIPDLAAEMPTTDNGGISKDGLVYTIKLRKDAKGSDGRPLTANDFVYSMKRAMDPKLAGPYTSNYFALKGAEAYNTAFGTKDAPKTASDAELARLRDDIGVKAKDDYILEYTLVRPSPSFVNLMAIWTSYPVRQDIIEKFGDKWTEPPNMVSNGPFVLKEWVHNDRFVMEPNPNWHGEKPKLSRLIISMIVDDTAAYAAYLNDELDLTIVPPANRREIQEQGNPLNKELVRGGDATTFALMMNNKLPPFDNPKVWHGLRPQGLRQCGASGCGSCGNDLDCFQPTRAQPKPWETV
jgi:ABC-type oligopeptide transport system substrate-binding subunit